MRHFTACLLIDIILVGSVKQTWFGLAVSSAPLRNTYMEKIREYTMKIFELQTKLTSYSYPLIKMTISIMIVLFSVFRNHLFTISLMPLNILVTLLCFIATLAAILCTYISIGELFYVWNNKKKQKRNWTIHSTNSNCLTVE